MLENNNDEQQLNAPEDESGFEAPQDSASDVALQVEEAPEEPAEGAEGGEDTPSETPVEATSTDDDESASDDDDDDGPVVIKEVAAFGGVERVTEGAEEDLPEPRTPTDDDDGVVKVKRTGKSDKPKKKRWYIIHTYSGHENKVKVNLERRIESMNMQDKIFRVESPSKTVTKIKEGRRVEREERLFPGYVLVEMILDDDSWYVVRHTPGVTKFVGSQKKPIPAKESEIRRILVRTTPASTKVQIDLKVGENVRIISGPFADFEGTVTEVSPEKEKLKATVSIFGRETPVELAFNQVVKL